MIGIVRPCDDALIVVGDIADFHSRRMLVDGGSAANVFTCEAILGMKVSSEKSKMVNTHLQGFGSH